MTIDSDNTVEKVGKHTVLFPLQGFDLLNFGGGAAAMLGVNVLLGVAY